MYGGWRAFYTSIYLHISLILLALTGPLWLSLNNFWWNDVLSVLPNLLGFTLGGFAIFISFGNDDFKAFISGTDPDENGKKSPFMGVCATFLHFVLVQFLALFTAIVCKAVWAWSQFLPCIPIIETFITPLRMIGWAFCYWLFLYGLMLIAAAALAIFRLATWYDDFQSSNRSK